MEDIIRKLTHDNSKFDSQWDKIENELEEKCGKGNISSILDSLAEYVLREPQKSSPSEYKFRFVTRIIETIAYKKDKSFVNHIFQVFIRVFDQGRIDLWHLNFLKELYQQFELKNYLPQKIQLIEQLILILQKHSFTLSHENESILEAWDHFWRYDVFDSDVLNETIVAPIKDKFQQLCR